MKFTKMKSAFAVLGLGLALVSAPAAAQITYFQPFTSFEDDDIEVVIDTDQSGSLTVGDRLISVIEWHTTSGVLAGQGPNTMGVELTGVADVTVVSSFVDAGGITRFVFGPTAGGLLSAFGAGTVVAAFTDTSADLNVINAACGTQAQCLALAGLGADPDSTLFMTAGFFGDADASWVYTGGTDISTVQGGPANASFGSFTYALDLGVNNSGMLFVDQSCAPFCGLGGNGMIEIVGSGQILGGQGLTNGWTARTDADFQVAPIPEPGSLALFGLALAGAGVFRFRRKLSK